MLQSNFHTHSQYCDHAQGTIDEYANSAVKAGLTALGFSEHSPLPKSAWRMHELDMISYCKQIADISNNYPIRGFCGLEMDVVSKLFSYYDTLKRKYKLDYCIASVHSISLAMGGEQDCLSLSKVDEVEAYFKLLSEACTSGLFSFIGHCDRLCINPDSLNIVANRQDLWTNFLKEAKDNGLPIELNSSHFSYGLYSQAKVQQLWQQVAKLGVDVLVNSDAHHPRNIVRAFNEAEEFLQFLAIKPINLASHLLQ
jgi:histidinol-phosphatase (PHP family)